MTHKLLRTDHPVTSYVISILYYNIVTKNISVMYFLYIKCKSLHISIVFGKSSSSQVIHMITEACFPPRSCISIHNVHIYIHIMIKCTVYPRCPGRSPRICGKTHTWPGPCSRRPPPPHPRDVCQCQYTALYIHI